MTVTTDLHGLLTRHVKLCTHPVYSTGPSPTRGPSGFVTEKLSDRGGDRKPLHLSELKLRHPLNELRHPQLKEQMK